jgi:glycosyltransferase involved in cell wall biosynthesis
MRIALLADYPLHTIPKLGVPNPCGHYATWLPQLCGAFAHVPEVDFHWLVVTRRDSLPTDVSWNNQQFHLIHEPGKMRALFGFRRESRRIREKLTAIKPDLVHAWGTEACYGLAAKRSGLRFLLSMQGLLNHYVQTIRMPPLVRLQAFYERQVLRNTQHATVESKWGEKILRRWLNDARIWLVEYGVQESFFRSTWQPHAGQPAAVFVGSITERKGIQDAVAAFQDPALANAELWIIGDVIGEWAEALRAESTKNVKWLGRLRPEETSAKIAEAWCLVLPTRADTSPNVVKEARVIGLPVITTPDGGQSDYVEDGKNGFQVKTGDIRALTSRLKQCLENLEWTRNLGAWKHQEQRDWFRPERTSERFLSIYSELCDDKG